MTRILIGLDDTDNPSSRGTGYLARTLLRHLAEAGMHAMGVTRHQLLVHPAIPYTSHNSGACVCVASGNGLEAARSAFAFVSEHAADGSDPGVCLVALDTVGPEIMAFGARATAEVLVMQTALDLGQQAGVELRPLGGTGEGVIGALASVGLRAAGNEGRFIELPGLRTLPRRVSQSDLAGLGIRVEHRGQRPPADGDVIETLDWIRPNLVQGQPVLPVEWSAEHDAWIPVDRKRSRPLE